jgi:hypothetical protein
MTDTSLAGMTEWQRNLLIALCALVATLALGFMTGATVAAIEDGLSPARLVLPASGLLVAAAAGWSGWRLHRAQAGEPVAPRIRKSRRMLVIGGLLGAVMGLLLAVSADQVGSGSVFDNAPIAPTIAVLAIVAWAVGGSLLTVTWLRSIDEHEMQANNAGAMAGLCTYLLIEPSWWLGWRGGFLPAQQPMITLILVLTVYSTVWFWRRNR